MFQNVFVPRNRGMDKGFLMKNASRHKMYDTTSSFCTFHIDAYHGGQNDYRPAFFISTSNSGKNDRDPAKDPRIPGAKHEPK